VVDECPESRTTAPGIAIRLLSPGNEPENSPANALCRRAGDATETLTVEWTFSYKAD
jgi:hypothetical protein